MKIKKIIIAIILLITVSLLSACGNNSNTSISTSTPDSEIIQTPTTLIETPTAREPTEVVNGLPTLFIFTPNSEIYFPVYSEIETMISNFEANGIEVKSANVLPSSDLFFTFVLLFNPTQETINFFDAGMANQLLIVAEELSNQPSTRTTLFTMSPADRVFIGGYLAAIMTEDWRVGGLLPDVEYENTPLTTIFQNGVEFMCGRCLPIYGPLVNFPVTATLSSPDNNDMTMQAFSEIYNDRLNSLYVPSAYLYDDFVILLQQNGIAIISDANLSNDKADWIDYAVEDNLTILIENSITQANQSENFLAQPVDYSIYSKFDNFPLGKANFIQNMIDNLQKGFISPYSAMQE